MTTVFECTMRFRMVCHATISSLIKDIETVLAISNVAKNLELKISPIMTKGIKDVGKWVHYCPGCRTNHTSGTECPACGTPLKRKLLKEK